MIIQAVLPDRDRDQNQNRVHFISDGNEIPVKDTFKLYVTVKFPNTLEAHTPLQAWRAIQQGHYAQRRCLVSHRIRLQPGERLDPERFMGLYSRGHSNTVIQVDADTFRFFFTPELEYGF